MSPYVDTALIILIAVLVIVKFLREQSCDARVDRATSEGERRMLAAFRIAHDLYNKENPK